MATTDLLVSRIKRRLSRTNDTTTTAAVIDELVAAQERLEDEPFLPAFLGGNEIQLAAQTTHIVDLASLITGFLRLDQRLGGALFYVDTAQDEPYVRIKRYDDREQLKQINAGDLVAGGFPLGYVAGDTTIELRPRPTASVPATLRVRYYKSDPTIPAAGNTTLWTAKAPMLIMGEAGAAIATYLRDDKALEVFNAMIARAKATLVRSDQAGEDADQEYVMGDPD